MFDCSQQPDLRLRPFCRSVFRIDLTRIDILHAERPVLIMQECVGHSLLPRHLLFPHLRFHFHLKIFLTHNIDDSIA